MTFIYSIKITCNNSQSLDAFLCYIHIINWIMERKVPTLSSLVLILRRRDGTHISDSDGSTLGIIVNRHQLGGNMKVLYTFFGGRGIRFKFTLFPNTFQFKMSRGKDRFRKTWRRGNMKKSNPHIQIQKNKKY